MIFNRLEGISNVALLVPLMVQVIHNSVIFKSDTPVPYSRETHQCHIQETHQCYCTRDTQQCHIQERHTREIQEIHNSVIYCTRDTQQCYIRHKRYPTVLYSVQEIQNSVIYCIIYTLQCYIYERSTTDLSSIYHREGHTLGMPVSSAPWSRLRSPCP